MEHASWKHIRADQWREKFSLSLLSVSFNWYKDISQGGPEWTDVYNYV